MTIRLAPQESPTSREPDGSAALRGYDHHVDGLFTYCLSVLCEHESAAGAVREVRSLVLRHGARLADQALLRAWLYSLARHCCLQRLGRARPAGDVAPGLAAERRQELASLAWPEAAGTAPEQREALELAVRHHLRTDEIAAVLGLSGQAAEALLAAAGAEVGRTRAALLVLGVGSCPVLAELGGVGAESWRGWVLGPALRRELVRHVVDCPTCRGTAERVAGGAAGLGEQGDQGGLADLSGLPMLPAPVALRLGPTASGGSGYDAAALPTATHDSAGAAFLAGAAAGRRALRTADGAERLELRFDQRGFPRHRAPGRTLRPGPAVRQRVVTTGVLAAVLTAPVVALWVAHRGGGGATTISAVRVDTPFPARVAPAATAPARPVVVPAPVALQLAAAAVAETLLPGPVGITAAPYRPGDPTTDPATPPAPAAPGQLTVEANDYAGRTVLTLTNTGGSSIEWHAVSDAAWLRLSRDSGTLEPGQRITVTVTVDDSTAPHTQWTAHLALPPSEAVVTLEGGPNHRGGPPPTAPPPTDNPPTTPPTSAPSPSPTTPSTPPPSSSPTSPAPSSPAPSSPPASSPPPSPSPSDSPSASPSEASSPPPASPTG
ncbi:BACON domain-containing protein [Kitasatospora sp. McL0602]|uniref:BACON domain-containing protein n=1 Tax=Kitasatospora sp. McL0602 TaxID=3439530 RepID=UPI003F895C35